MDILLVENDCELALFIERSLNDFDHNVTICTSIKDFLNGKLFVNYDLIILDLVLDGEMGSDLLSYIRRKKIDIPVIVLSSIVNVTSKVDLLRLGADDYMTKPFDVSELNARIEALGKRRVNVVIDDEENFGDVKVFWKQNKVVRDGKDIILTQKEGELIKILLRNKGKTVSANYILNKIWNVGMGYHSNILQSMVRRLRKKIDGDFEKKIIKNIHGVGYMLDL